jgi:hypothetical protein
MCPVHMYSMLVEVRTKPYVLHVSVIFGWGRFLYKSFSFPVSLSSSNAPFSCFICLPLVLYNLSSWQHCEIKHLSVSPPCLCIILTVFIFYCFVWENFMYMECAGHCSKALHVGISWFTFNWHTYTSFKSIKVVVIQSSYRLSNIV